MNKNFSPRFLAGLLLLLLTHAANCASPAQADSVPALPKRLVVASSNNFPPLNMLDRQGELQGFGRDLSDAVLRSLGVEVERVHSARWPEVLSWIASGQADFIHDTGYTPEREAYLDFTLPILSMDEVIFVRNDQVDIHDLKSLAGKRVACVNQHITHLYLKQFDWISCELVATPIDGVRSLLSGQVDAFIYPREIVLYHLQQLSARDNVKITGSALRTLSWSMSVKRGNRALVELLNRGIQQVRSSGEYDRIRDKWFGAAVLVGYTSREVWLITLSSSAAAMGLLLAIAFGLYSRAVNRSNLRLQSTLDNLRSTQSALTSTENKFRLAMDAVRDGLWDLDVASQHIDFSTGWNRILGEIPHPPHFASWQDRVHPDDRIQFLESLRAHLDGETLSWHAEHRLRHANGEWVWALGRGQVVERDAAGKPRRMVGTLTDITRRRHRDEQVRHLAYHDQLTGLPNRALFLDRLGQSLAAAHRTQRYGALLFADLDQFKHINDVQGHEIGDKVLCHVAQRLSAALRQGDTVARLGGDEFVILLPDLGDTPENSARMAISVGQKLLDVLAPPIRIDDKEFRATASFGIALFPQAHEGVEDLIRDADIAMYRAKDLGRNTVVLFEQHMQTAVADRYGLEQDLRKAISRGELELFVQSKVDPLNTVVGAEALLRWRHPSRGLVPPVRFIALAEETGVILELGEWVLRETCRLEVLLAAQGKPLNLSVNVSPHQFSEPNFVERCRTIIRETGADASRLTFEITENLLLEQTSDLVPRMHELASLGIRFALDDFGTGYSSLAYLKRLPLNEVKIDKSFVDALPDDPNDVAIVETIISMAHHLGLLVVAEGVETKEQLQFLGARGCNLFQGYFFHRPQIADAWMVGLESELPASVTADASSN